jgi:hypothetical protein
VVDQALVLRTVQAELAALREPQLWMTARGLAARLRSDHPELRSLSQERLYVIMAEHAEHAANRVIRNSPYPSARTLEVLWGAIARVGEFSVEPPRRLPTSVDEVELLIKSRLHASAGAPADTEVADAPDYFLSYNNKDSAAAIALTEMLESKGHSIWMAGAAIAVGDIINDTVRSAMAASRGMLLYLSSDSLRSLWVAKEQLVAAAGELPRLVVIRGDDPDLMGLVSHWMAGGQDSDRDEDDFGGLLQVDDLSYQVAASFRGELRAHVEDVTRPIYLFPSSDHHNDRLRPLEAFPEADPRQPRSS